MKKAIFTLAVTAAAVSSSFAQGYIAFNNGTATPVKANSSLDGTSFTSVPITSSYYFALFYSGTAITVNGSAAAVVGGVANGNNVASKFVFSDSNWTIDSGVTGIVAGTRPGFIADSTYISSGATQTQVPLAAGSTGQFVVLGWSANIGSTVQSVETWLAGSDGALAGWIGQSPVGSQTVSPGSPSPVNSIFGAAPQVTGFNLGEAVPTPEPTSIALGVMGGLSVLALRRKKA